MSELLQLPDPRCFNCRLISYANPSSLLAWWKQRSGSVSLDPLSGRRPQGWGCATGGYGCLSQDMIIHSRRLCDARAPKLGLCLRKQHLWILTQKIRQLHSDLGDGGVQNGGVRSQCGDDGLLNLLLKCGCSGCHIGGVHILNYKVRCGLELELERRT